MTCSNHERAAGPAARRVTLFTWLVAAALMPAWAVAQEPPAELRGTVTGVVGDRVTIGLPDVAWLPPLGTEVTIGMEMSGMFVPLKGRFVVVQVSADGCAAQPVRGVEHGAAAAGMVATLNTAYPNRPRSKADFRSAVTRLELMLPLADTGDPNACGAAAMAYESMGDADHALSMWARVQASARERLLVHNAAKAQVRILEVRGQYEEAIAVLRDATTRTAPADGDLAWRAYGDPATGVEWHVGLLTALANLYRVSLRDRAQADAWNRKAAEIMAAAATRGAPPASGETPYGFLALLMGLGDLQQYDLEDVEAAVPWYQEAARRGHAPAQEVLKKLGRSW